MASSGDLIDFEAIEVQKENIQSLPGGRSAKQLSLLCSPISAKQPTTLSQSQELKNAIRQDFEKELQTIDEADDPLEVYDRYVKWTLNAYPSAQATPESGLRPLIERATSSLLSNTTYKNDPRYLKIWLLYIKFFSDTPRETYAFLARHDIGERLALYYEEFAAWLEQQGHWSQAEQVYCAGVDKEARPKERLLRKYAEFQHRRDAKTTSNDGPDSPALPKVRPALVARSEISFADASDPQADDRRAAQSTAARPSKPTRAKMTIFSDADADPAPEAATKSGDLRWDGIGSIADRKKENTREPTAWAGERLDGGRKMAEPKMSVFKDPTIAKLEIQMSNPSYRPTGLERLSLDAKGRKQYVYANLEIIYPNGVGNATEEFCFEELRARKRGWLRENCAESMTRPVKQLLKQHESESTCHLNLPASTAADLQSQQQIVEETDENKPPSTTRAVTVPLQDSPSAANRRARREEKANKTRKIKIVQVEVKQEAQTIQLNLDSPSGPTKIRKKKPEATMTIHTKEAMNEVYDIFNQPLDPTPESADHDDEGDNSDTNVDDEDEDDYTSAGESTGTGQISAGASEYGDETTPDFTASSRVDADTSSMTQTTNGDTDFSEYTNTNTNTNTSGITEGNESADEDLSRVSISPEALSDGGERTHATVSSNNDDVDEARPVSPGTVNEEFEHSYVEHDLPTPSNPPYRLGKGAGRLPFMTPIVEKTESSLGALTSAGDKSYAYLKTPSRQNHHGGSVPIIEDDSDREDESDLPSSPFQEVTEPLAPVHATSAVASALDKLSIRAGTSTSASLDPSASSEIRRMDGPIIPDRQCNPINTEVRKQILNNIRPALDTLVGYLDHRGSSACLGTKIRKYAKSVHDKKGPADTASLPPVLDFDRAHCVYTIRRELGRGAFAPVYLVDSTAHGESPDKETHISRGGQEVIKMEDPPTPWEFYIISQVRNRLRHSREAQSIVRAHEMHIFDDEGYLIEEYRAQGTLLDAINICRSEGAMDEMLAMFFVVEIFRTVEAVHAGGIIHGDLKPDNILMRLDEGHWDSQYQSDGSGGWSGKGILLIDFGRGIDMTGFRPDVQFIADWKTTDADCAEMREMRPWTFQVDYHGLAGTIHSLLFGKYMETVQDRGMAIGAGAVKSYKIKEVLKRYWQTDIWAECFEVLLNPLTHLNADDGSKLPISGKIRQLRESMEAHLSANCEKGVGLKPLIRRLEASLKERKR